MATHIRNRTQCVAQQTASSQTFCSQQPVDMRPGGPQSYAGRGSEKNNRGSILGIELWTSTYHDIRISYQQPSAQQYTLLISVDVHEYEKCQYKSHTFGMERVCDDSFSAGQDDPQFHKNHKIYKLNYKCQPLAVSSEQDQITPL